MDNEKCYIQIKTTDKKNEKTIRYIDLQKKENDTCYRYYRYLLKIIPAEEIANRLASFTDSFFSKMEKIDDIVHNRHGIFIVGWLKNDQPVLFWSKPTDTENHWCGYSPDQESNFQKAAFVLQVQGEGKLGIITAIYISEEDIAITREVTSSELRINDEETTQP